MPAVGDSSMKEQMAVLVQYAKDEDLEGGEHEWRLGRRRVYPATWKDGRVASWLVTVDHKRIGICTSCTSLVFFVGGGIAALLHARAARDAERAFPTNNLDDEVLDLSHGMSMVFLVVVPIFAGFGIFLVPLMIGACDMAFPRLNAFSYWLFLVAGIASTAAWFSRRAARRGPARWSYPIFSEIQFSPVHGQDYWILALHILMISSLARCDHFIVTIVKHVRARDVLDAHAPLFIWVLLPTRSCFCSRRPAPRPA